MQIQPILAALKHHKLATVLIALEIALACAVFCNACALIADRLTLMRVDSGVAEPSLGTIQISGYENTQAADLNARVLTGLRSIAGVQSVSVLNSIPFGARRGTAGFSKDAAGKQFGGVVEFYLGGPGAFQALGVQVIAGRGPAPDDFKPFDGLMPGQSAVEMTRALAEHLWPGENPLGKEIWAFDSHYRVVGIIDHLVRPDPTGWPQGQRDWSSFVPGEPGKFLSGSYLLRADPAQLPRVLRDAKAAIAKIAPEVVLDHEQSRTLNDLRERSFKSNRAMTGVLVGVIVALLGVTALGIVGLASFWVAQRRRQIGIRRALGATRNDILRYFQVENFLIVTFGVVLGLGLAIGINLALMKWFEVARMPLWYLPVGAIALWVLGQLAVLAPALRAADVPPVVATRSV
ncbi:MAG: FtsX-like permease family protein [Proteobacteria bacterium]|nr:FtsX-like permease family protein [Pseudomonadota bacterium]